MHSAGASALQAESHHRQHLETHWYGPEHAVCVRLQTGGECGIFGEDCDAMALDTATLDGLPGAWLVQGMRYTAAKLSCGHNFHVSMLALHFLSSDMRCPLCRAGPAGEMYLRCVPRSARRDVRTRLRLLEDRARHAEDRRIMSQLSATSSRGIEADLRLMVTIHHRGLDNTCLAHVLSGCVYVPGLRDLDEHDSSLDAPGGFCFHLTLQRNFVRHVLSRMRHMQHEVGQCTVQFSLEHPLFEVAVSTRRFSPSVAATYPLVSAAHAGLASITIGQVAFDTEAQSITAAINQHCVRALLLETAARE